MEKYETIETLGEGAFAVVTKARDKVSGSIVAIKKLKKKYPTWQECVDLREVKSLNVLKKNENIVKLKEMIRVEDNLYLVFEYMEKNLLELIIGRQSKKFNESQIRCVMWQTLQGLAYMHKYGFFHRDLKPENLLVSGETVKIADFGLAREIRSLPPYTDYVSTRYYRAPECILKSTNYNSPIDVWALGCIMVEMYNQKPIFVGNSEKEVLFRICSVLGTPTNTTWLEGVQMAKKIDLKFPTCSGVILSQVIPDASKEALDFLSFMLRWDPNKRADASYLLTHPYFTLFPLPNRISTPDYSSSTITAKNVKTYSNVGRTPTLQIETKLKYETNKKDETDFSSLLNDTKGFNEFLQKIKNEKQEEDMKFIENKNCSPIAKRLDDEFDFELPAYFKDNQTTYGDNTLYSSNSILNANISNITGMGMASSLLTTNGMNNGTVYQYNKNFFDTTTLNNINGNRSLQGSNGSGSHGSNDKETCDLPKESEELVQNSRRKNLGMSNLINIECNDEKKKLEETEKKKEMDFDNCNVYLKSEGETNNPNRLSSRKRSAYKFIESTLDKNSASININPNAEVSNAIKSTGKDLNTQFGNFNLRGKEAPGNLMMKNNITSTNALNEKKTEYQSRRKNQTNITNNILSEMDNPRVVDINIHTSASNKSEIDKNDHFNFGFRKAKEGSNNSLNYKETEHKKPHNSESNLGLFNSRRHITNTNTINTFNSPTNQINSSVPNNSKPNKEKNKNLII